MKKPSRSTLWILGGTALIFAAFTLRGMVPEIVRFLRIKRM